MKKSRKYFEQLFATYPDVVTITEFRKMLGGISGSTAYKLMRENRVKHFYIQTTFLIPKSWVIDYVMSDHYNEYIERLKVKILNFEERGLISLASTTYPNKWEHLTKVLLPFCLLSAYTLHRFEGNT